MQTTSVKLYSMTYRQAATYGAALLFAAGNIVLPQLCHLIPQGGLIFLPIYFFTLVGAYKYGWRVGLLTAVLSPLANHLLFGMPPAPMLAPILVKSVVLALAAGYAAARFHRVSLSIMAGVVLFYQIIGSVVEWGMTGSIVAALQDFRLGIPGMALQIAGGYLFIKHLLRK